MGIMLAFKAAGNRLLFMPRQQQDEAGSPLGQFMNWTSTEGVLARGPQLIQSNPDNIC